MASMTSNNLLRAAVFAGTLGLFGQTALADPQFLDVRDIFQLDGDAFDTEPTFGEPLIGEPPGGLTAPGSNDDQGNHPDVDDWAQFDDDAIVPSGCVDPLGILTPPESCGHVGGPEDNSESDAGQQHNLLLPTASLDGHTGGNSLVHFYGRDADRMRAKDLDIPLQDDFFTQGSALNQDVCDWRVDFSSTPPKNDIANAMAGFYLATNTDPDDMDPLAPPREEAFFYAAASVIAPNGTAKVLYWLLQGDLVLIAPDEPPSSPFVTNPFMVDYSGRFVPSSFDPLTDPDPCTELNASGGRFELHVPGDFAFATDFEGGGADVLPVFFEWKRPDPSMDGFIEQTTPPGTPSAGNNCQDSSASGAVCATSNADIDPTIVQDKDRARVTESPDTYEYFASLSGPNLPAPGDDTIPTGNFGVTIDPDEFPGTTFFEGGFNFEAADVPLGCFNTFIATTVASASVTAAMKDMISGKLPICSVDVSTEIHEGPAASDPADPVDIQGLSVFVGDTVHDQVTVVGSAPLVDADPTGTVTFARYDNDTCSGTPVFTEDIPLPVADTDPTDGIVIAESSDFVTTTAGGLSYKATYNSDINFPAGTALCEPLTVVALGRIKLIKVSTGDGAEFDFTNTGATGLATELTTLAGTNQMAMDTSDLLVPGTGYAVGETPETGWDLTAMECKLEDGITDTGTVSGNGFTDVEVEAGKTTTCTFTNVQRGDIKLIKVSTGDGAEFDFTNTGATGLATELTTLAGTNQMAMDTSDLLAPGTGYAVGETPETGWDLTDMECKLEDGTTDTGTVAGSGFTDVEVEAGKTTTCTFTNVQLGRILIDKVTNPVGDPQEFQFTLTGGPSALVQGFMLADASALHNSGFVKSGSGYTAAEINIPSNWDLTGTVCDDNVATGTGVTPSTVGNINVSPGETVTCTFFDTKRAKVIIDKNTLPSPDAQKFNFTLAGGEDGINQPFMLAHADTPHDSGYLTPGATNIVATETLPLDTPTVIWTLTGISCAVTDNGGDGAQSTFTTDGTPISSPTQGKATITNLAPGEVVTCTFTNTKTVPGNGIIQICKIEIGDQGVPFSFANDIDVDPTGVVTPFMLTPPTENVEECLTFNNVKTLIGIPVEYFVTETVVSGWDLTDLTCNDAASPTPSTTAGTTATIQLDDGEALKCTFTNTKRGKINITKVTIGGINTFDYTGTVTSSADIGTVFDGDLTTATPGVGVTEMALDVTPGTYTATETAQMGWDLTNLTCDDGASATPSTTSGSTATYEVDPGEEVGCTFTNTKRGKINITKVTIGDIGTFDYTGTVTSSADIGTVFDGDLTTAVPGVGVTEMALDVKPGTYTATETDQDGWDLTNLTCDDGASTTPSTTSGSTATYEVDPGEEVGCTFTNTRRGMADVLKTTLGVPAAGFTFEIRVGASELATGTVVANATSDGTAIPVAFACDAAISADICVDVLGMAKIVPGVYQFCETGMLAGWMNDIPSPPGFTPLGATPEGGDNSTECFDFTLDPGETEHFVVNNVPPPGGDARTIGFWKNWTSCDGHGNQFAQLDYVLNNPMFPGQVPFSIGTQVFDDTAVGVPFDCQRAVDLLDKRAIRSAALVGDGKKKASDAAYALAAQLLAARLNFAAGADMSCPAYTAAAIAGQTLLATLSPWPFDGGMTGTVPGTTSFLPPNSSGTTADDRADALMYAALLDDYNNNEPCPP